MTEHDADAILRELERVDEWLDHTDAGRATGTFARPGPHHAPACMRARRAHVHDAQSRAVIPGSDSAQSRVRGGEAGGGYAHWPALLVPLQARAHGHASGAKAGLPDSG